VSEPTQRERPWSHLADVEQHDAYADFPAWERWLVAIDPDFADILSELEDSTQVGLYVLMCDLAEGTAIPTHAERVADIRKMLADMERRAK
jgi:hypothetical protein